MNKHLFWIASYPKSGNTLLRAIISSLFFSENGHFDFNMLNKIPVIEDVANLEFIKNINIKDFEKIHKLEILAKYWLDIQSKKNLNFNGDFMFVKTHHALVKMFDNPFTTDNNTRGIIYIIRDPRDVVLSMCKHYNFDIKKSIEKITNINFSLKWADYTDVFMSRERPFSLLSNWDNHYKSWKSNSFKCPQLFIKYEDLVYKKKEVIKKLVVFFEKNYGFKFSNLEEKIENIIIETNFEKLKKKEELHGFQEAVSGAFFNIGKKNQWLEKLTADQIYEIEKNFYKTLVELKYDLKYFNPISN